ncbi:MAG: acyltransferase domain-containing protein [Bdellovibrionales bacterium]|nr:acyltransferase domain-containing protein [Bdellovibrionales bacterium]
MHQAELRRIVETLWRELFRLPGNFDHDKSFMDLGGTSMAASMLTARLSKELARGISATKIFEYPTLTHFLQYLESGDSGIEAFAAAPEAPIPSASPTEPRPLDGLSGDRARDIAIVGMACRFAGASDADQFWSNLVQGKESNCTIAVEDLSDEVPEELRNDPRYVRVRGMIDRPYAMDAAFFDVSPMEAKIIDPQQRVLLETAWDALEHAGHGSGSFAGRAAVFAGIEDNSYYRQEIAPFPEAEKRAGRLTVMTGNEKDFVALRIAHKLNLRGPAVSVHTACSTSLVAVIMACKSLRNGEADLALAGGAAVHFPTHEGYYFQKGGIFSSDGSCRAFDKDAEGTIFTDGSGVVVLKRLSDAIRDRDTIYAVIKGGAINNDGDDKASFSAPSIAGQARCIADAQDDAGVDPRTISYVEAHGTATPMGDPIEVEALRQAFHRKTLDKQFCGLGSVKSNIGHTTAAAGVAGLIKAALALKHKVIPPSLHFKTPNPDLDLENSPFYVVNRLTPWNRMGGPRRAALSSFGIGGTNSHVILEEAPETEEPKAQVLVRPFEVLPVSGKSVAQRDSLMSGIAGLKDPIRDIAFTLQNGRTRFKPRGAIVRLASGPGYDAGPDLTVQRDSVISKPKLAFMFPGQGSQDIEMGKSLYERFAEFRETFDVCAEQLSKEFGLCFKAFIFNAANKETLENTRYTQPALFAIEVSLGRMLLAWGLRPEVMIGHSIGEFAAACLSGVFSLEDGLKLIAARGRLMGSLPSGKMLSVRAAAESVRSHAVGGVDLAAINSPVHCVLAGPDERIAEVQAELEKTGVACKLLHTSHAFHSGMMSPVVEPFREIAKTVTYGAPRFKIISTVTGEPLTDAQATDPLYWANHLRQTVRFSQAVAHAVTQGYNVFLEVGPRVNLSSLVALHIKGLDATAISTLSDQSNPATELGALGLALGKLWVSGIELPWNEIWPGGRRIPLLPYPFERKDFRFSEGRERVAAVERPQRDETGETEEADEVIEEAEEAEEAAPVADVRGLLMSDLGAVLSEYSGMTASDIQGTFIESGFDSLVLMQIGVELGKKYGVSVSLRDLMEKTNTLALLADRLIQSAAPDKLPQTVARAPKAKKKAQLPTRSLPQKAVSLAPPPMGADMAEVIHQQLTQMRQVIELQLQYLETAPRTGPAIAGRVGLVSKAPAPTGLMRAKYVSPPVQGAFRAPGAKGGEAWHRFDPDTGRYEEIQ